MYFYFIFIYIMYLNYNNYFDYFFIINNIVSVLTFIGIDNSISFYFYCVGFIGVAIGGLILLMCGAGKKVGEKFSRESLKERLFSVVLLRLNKVIVVERKITQKQQAVRMMEIARTLVTLVVTVILVVTVTLVAVAVAVVVSNCLWIDLFNKLRFIYFSLLWLRLTLEVQSSDDKNKEYKGCKKDFENRSG